MMSFTTVGMDTLNQPLPADAPVELSGNLPPPGSYFGGGIDARSYSFWEGRNLTSLRTGNTSGPRIGSCSHGQSSHHGTQEDLDADCEFEEESTARMHSLVPSDLLQDDARDYRDNSPILRSELEIPRGTNLNNDTERRSQELPPCRAAYQTDARDGCVGARRDQDFDSDRLSYDGEFAPRRCVPTPAAGYDPISVPKLAGRYAANPEPRRVQYEARRRENESALPGSLEPCVQAQSGNENLSYFPGSQPSGEGTGISLVVNECQEQLKRMNSRDINDAIACWKYLKERQPVHSERVEGMTTRNAARNGQYSRLYPDSTAHPRPFAERERLYQQEALHHGNNVDQSSLLERLNRGLMINEPLARMPNRPYQQGCLPSDAEKATIDLFEFEQLRKSHAMNFLMLNAHIQAVTARLSQFNGLSSPQLTSRACSSAATSRDSIHTSMRHPPALRQRSRDLRQETVCARNSSLKNTPEKKPDGYPCNSYSPPRLKSTSSSPATKALIAQGAKSISVILKPEHSGSRGRSSYPASPLSVGSTSVSPAGSGEGSGSMSPIHRLNMSTTDGLQLIPNENPSVELDVCNQGQFKTELCNNWEDSQSCRYGEHCRFAHGVDELRYVLRHHRYKSVACRMIMSGKDCIYGHRCHYRHLLSPEEELSRISEARLVPRTSL